MDGTGAAKKSRPDPNFQWETLEEPTFMATRVLDAYRYKIHGLWTFHEFN